MELPTTLNKPIIYDDINKVNDNLYKPKGIVESLMTKYELTSILGLRTTQLANGAISFVDLSEEISSNRDLNKIATQELMLKKLPYIVCRTMPNNKNNYIRISDLDLTAVKHMFRV
jgi:DNA-directed RNA polymerase subunit K/omega